jgi:DegV family protein with EDD domain
MPEVAVVTDSTADFPAGEAERFGIKIVPLYVRFGDQEYIDKVNLSSDEFFAKLKKSPVLPVTSQPSPDDFLKIYREVGTDKIISIHISGKLSGAINSAMRPKNEVLHSFDIRVIDSQTSSLGLGFLVIEAAKMAKNRNSLDTIEAEINRLIPKTRLYGVLDTLHYLEKGGRIGTVQYWVGSLLQLKPIIRLKDGEVAPVERSRTKKKAIERLIEIVKSEGKMKRLGVIHTVAKEDAEKLAANLKEIYPELDIPVVQTGPIIGTHAGPGLIGICGLLK